MTEPAKHPFLASCAKVTGPVVLLAAWLAFTPYIPAVRTHVLDSIHETFGAFEKSGLQRRLPYSTDCVAAVAIGMLGYERPDVRILDMVGLISPEVAAHKGRNGLLMPGHHCSNAPWVLDQDPDVIFLAEELPLPAILDVMAHPDFRERYERAAPGIWVRKRETEAASSE